MLNPQPNALLLAALELLDEGISCMPIDAESKMPLIQWKRYQTEHPTAEDWEQWAQQWPTAHLGLITGAISGLVVCEGDTAEAVEWVAANYPHTPRRCATKRGRHFYFRHPGGRVKNSASVLHPGVDVRGDGGYVKVPPSQGYAWDLDPGADFTDLPIWPGTAQVIDLSTAKVRGPRVPVAISKGGRDNALAQFAGTLAKAGMSLQDIVDALAEVNRTYDPPMADADLMRVANSIYTAEQIKHAPVVPGPAAAQDFPAHLLAPGGVLGGMMSYIEQSAPFYQPVFALAASIATLGAVLGQKVATDSNLRTNFYLLGVGHTGTGKEAARSAMIRLLTETGMERFLGPENFASHAAIMRAMVEHPVQVVYLDEIGHLFKAVRNPNSHQAGIPTLLTKLFSYAGSTYLGDAYGAIDRKREPVRQPNLCIYGTSVPGRVFDNITPDEVTDGFLPRWLIFEVDAEKPPRRRKLDSAVPDELAAVMNHLGLLQAERDPNNMLATVPTICTLQPDAQLLMDAFEEECRLRQNAVRDRDPMEAGILNRSAEHAAKLALVRAVSDACGPQPIHAEHAQWAIDLVRHVSTGMIQQANERVSDGEFDAACNRVLAAITRAGAEGLTERELKRRIHGLRPQEFAEILTILRERGDAFEQLPERSASGQQPAMRWFRCN